MSDCFTSPTRHIVLEMASKLGFSGTIDVTPEIFLTVEERDRFASAGGTIAVSPSGLAKRLPMLNKEWFFPVFRTCAIGSPTTNRYKLEAGRTRFQVTFVIIAAGLISENRLHYLRIPPALLDRSAFKCTLLDLLAAHPS